MPSYSPAIAFRRFSSSIVASRPGLNSSPVDMPSAPASIASRMKSSICADCASVGFGPDTPAAARIALCPTNQARFGECPTFEMKSRCSPNVLHGISGPSKPKVCRRSVWYTREKSVTGA